jgi:hypothetical protein
MRIRCPCRAARVRERLWIAEREWRHSSRLRNARRRQRFAARPVPNDLQTVPVGVNIIDMPDPRPSPVFALNWAARNLAAGDILLFAIDGARIFSDRLYAATLAVHDLVLSIPSDGASGHRCRCNRLRRAMTKASRIASFAKCGWPHRPAGSPRGFGCSLGVRASRVLGWIIESYAFSVPRGRLERIGGFTSVSTFAGRRARQSRDFAPYVCRDRARNVCLL